MCVCRCIGLGGLWYRVRDTKSTARSFDKTMLKVPPRVRVCRCNPYVVKMGLESRV